jgi:hypothetical protein
LAIPKILASLLRERYAKTSMVKAYHRVSSNSAYEAILGIGAILPAAWRMHSDQALYLCEGELEDISGQKPEARQGVDRLLHERIREISDLQKREKLNPPLTHTTMLFCADLIAGDFMNVFLSPGGFTNAMAARGWPLSGFAFDAEELIRLGAEYRPEDLGFHFKSAINSTLRSDFGKHGAYEAVKISLEEKRLKVLKGNDVLKAMKIFDKPSHDPTAHREYDWPANPEIVWHGPLPLDLAVEFWMNGKRVEGRAA